MDRFTCSAPSVLGVPSLHLRLEDFGICHIMIKFHVEVYRSDVANGD